MSDAVVQRVTKMVAPLVADMKLDLYDVEYRGGVLRITIDTPPGSPGGVTLDEIALLTRMIGRDFDHDDPMPGHYTLEVTSPGLERTLRLPTHFQREIGKIVNVRLRDVASGDRRVQGTLISATETDAVVRLDDAELTERTIAYSQIDRAKTVFIWGPAPKPGKAPAKKAGTPKTAAKKPSAGAKPVGPSDEMDTADAAPQSTPTSRDSKLKETQEAS
jgi:ribosome maturation factor RimP